MLGRARIWLVPLVACVALLSAALFLRRREAPAAPLPAPLPERTSASVPPVPPPPPPADPLIAEWRRAILGRNAKALQDSQQAVRGREESHREALAALSKEDPEPRVRAFAVTLLSAFSRPPAEAYFASRLDDPHEYPRESAIEALRKLGTPASLPALDRAAGSDPAARLRPLAAQAAQSIRSRHP